MPALRQPVLEDSRRQFRDVIRLVEILEIQASGHAVVGKHRIQLVFFANVERRIIHVQRLATVSRPPFARPRQESQDPLDEILSHAQVLHVLVFARVPAAQHDEHVAQVSRSPRQTHAFTNTLKRHEFNGVAHLDVEPSLVQTKHFRRTDLRRSIADRCFQKNVDDIPSLHGRPITKQMLQLKQLLRKSDNILAEGRHPVVLSTSPLPQVTHIDLHVQQREQHFFDDRGVVEKKVKLSQEVFVVSTERAKIQVRQTPQQVHHILG